MTQTVWATSPSKLPSPETAGQAALEVETNPELEALVKGASERLAGASRNALVGLPEAELLALLNSPEGATLSKQEEEMLVALNKEAFESTLSYQTGSVELGEGLATLNLGDHFRYLDPTNAERLLVEGWGNPPGGESLGMIIPKSTSPLHDTRGWGVVVTYSEDGHVDDEDADDIDYDDLLEEMKDDTKEASKLRAEQGYGTMELIGWAEPPHYDSTNHRLFWAKELAFSEAPEHTLNYSIRVLGRKGVLELNAVAGMTQLSSIKADMQKVLPLAEFKSGQTYGDFDADIDEVAAYGIGGLIAGKVLAKAGIFAGLFKLILALKKVLILGAVGLFAGLAKWFKGRGSE